jgi:hypothetical protein
MKITINKEKYINNPCPEITKDYWDWFYSTLWISFMHNNSTNVKILYSIDIRINQAFRGCSNIHFYITINKGLDDEFLFHKVFDGFVKDAYQRKRKRWKWMYDFYNCGNIDLGTDKHIIRYNNFMDLYKAKKLTRKRVEQLVNDYKRYQKLKEFFGNIE